ncbi:MAG: hypothetical protein AAFO70_06930 [Pseudomonadota bacterium]
MGWLDPKLPLQCCAEVGSLGHLCGMACIARMGDPQEIELTQNGRAQKHRATDVEWFERKIVSDCSRCVGAICQYFDHLTLAVRVDEIDQLIKRGAHLIRAQLCVAFLTTKSTTREQQQFIRTIFIR